MKKIILLLLTIFTVINCKLSFAKIVSTPLQEHVHEKIDSCSFVLFGATGDLAVRKLYPALYYLALEGRLSDHIAVVGTSRTAHDDQSFRDLVKNSIQTYVSELDPIVWKFLEDRLFYHCLSADETKGYDTLHTFLLSLDQRLNLRANRLYYLATQPSLFEIIIANLHAHHLISSPKDSSCWTRVLIEKPFGFSLSSALDLQKSISRYLDENQIYRIDHYLGKEGVSHLLSLRFDQKLFEPIWNRHYIDQVQISFSEDLGVGARANFWEETGALRDFFQNHLMQLLAILAMEVPDSTTKENRIEEKVKVLQAIRPFPLNDLNDYIIRGQYGPGEINGKAVSGYRQEAGVSSSSFVETFVAAKLWIDNERWKGVPFYIRGGKRMPKQSVDIAIAFKNTDVTLPSILSIRIQPQIRIELNSHEILSMKPMKPIKDAYENVIYEGLRGNHALFVHIDEVIAAWRLLTPILETWKNRIPEDFPNYKAGSNGPIEADLLLIPQNHHWLSSTLELLRGR